MSTQKIYEVRPEGPSFFFRFLEFLAQKNNWALEFHHTTELTPAVYADAQAIYVDMSMSRPLLDDCQLQPTLVRNLQCLDSFFKDDGAWLPRNLIYEALRRVLITAARDLDIRQPAFVVGHDEKMRIVASLLAEIGFSEIYLVSTDIADLEEEIEFLSRRQLGIRFHKIPADELTMQVVSASIVINSDDLSTDEPLLSDLSYFNYMKGNGYVLDLHWDAEHNLLLEEALNAELKTLHPELILWNLVLLWADRLNIETQMKVEELRENWIFFLKQNSSSV
jgi:shikimate dehydrogenase